MKKIRVLHAPFSIGGNAYNLSQSMKMLGISSESATLSIDYIRYPSDHIIWNESDNLIIRELKRIRLIFWALRRFDVIHFNYGTTLSTSFSFPASSELSHGVGLFLLKFLGAIYTNFLQFIELLLLKLCCKKIFITYQGDDARQGDFCLANFSTSIATQVSSDYYNKKSDNFKRNKIKKLAKLAHQIYALNPDLLHVLPSSAKFMPYSHISLEEWIPINIQNESRPIRILHAPTNRKVKGTDYLINCLEQLKNEGLEFELILVESTSNLEAKKIYQTVDILVDQLFAGWYGGLAVELMALAKPVIVYIRDEDLKFVPDEMVADLPFIRSDAYNITDILRKVIKMPRSELYDLGQKSRLYVEKWHNPMKIAHDTLIDYQNSFEIL